MGRTLPPSFAQALAENPDDLEAAIKQDRAAMEEWVRECERFSFVIPLGVIMLFIAFLFLGWSFFL